jgi:hypothetical protein
MVDLLFKALSSGLMGGEGDTWEKGAAAEITGAGEMRHR